MPVLPGAGPIAVGDGRISGVPALDNGARVDFDDTVELSGAVVTP